VSLLGPLIAKEVLDDFKQVGRTPPTPPPPEKGMNAILVLLLTGGFLGGGFLVIELLEWIFGPTNWLFRLTGLWIFGAIFCTPAFLVVLYDFVTSDDRRQMLVEAIAFFAIKKSELARSAERLKQEVKQHIEDQGQAK